MAATIMLNNVRCYNLIDHQRALLRFLQMHINGKKSANANVAMYVLHAHHNSKVIPQDMT